MINLFSRRKKIGPYQIFGINPQDLIFNDGIDFSKSSLILNIDVENIQKLSDNYILWDDNTSIHYSGNFDSVALQAQTMQSQMVNYGNVMNIQPAYVYELNDHLENKIQNSEIKLLNDKFLLIKHPTHYSTSVSKVLFLAQAHQYKPIMILPHGFVERFNFHRDKKEIDKLIARDCHFQLNYLYLTGYYGSHPERLAKYLLDSGSTRLLGMKCSELSIIVKQPDSMLLNKYAQLLK